MNFTDKICPYCKTQFKEGDDIVVCSVCEMPHHKECWIENKACTTFGCTGTIVGAEQYADAADNNRFCSKCGAAMSDGQKFCSKCGAAAGTTGEPHFKVSGENNANPNTYIPHRQQYTNQFNTSYGSTGQQQQIDGDLYAFLQSNQPVYIGKFQKMQTANSKTSWNWCSFLFCGSWFAFRKMYGMAAAFIGLALFFQIIPGIGWLLQLALSICSGIFGDNLYMQYVYRELQTAKNMDDYNKSAYITKKGGTSIGAVFVAVFAASVIGAVYGTVINM